jgi:hypothetical protein
MFCRSKLWQDSMGMKFIGDSMRNYRICSRHFTPDSYIGTKLRANAIPTLLTCSSSYGHVKENLESVPLCCDELANVACEGKT